MYFFRIFVLLLLGPHLASANIVYVDLTAAGAATGTSWSDAYPSLANALASAQAGDTLWVASGAYLPTNDGNRHSSFQPASGVALYGGFAGTETSLGERDWEANPTFLSGDIGQAGNNGDNSYHVLSLIDVTGVTIDGFRITGGNNDLFSVFDSPRSGGGMILSGAQVSLFNVTFTNNTARFGGAVALWSNAQLNAHNCFFSDNTATQQQGKAGGAVYAQDSDCQSIFTNSRFQHNRILNGSGAGGGVAGGDNRFIQCLFIDNISASGMAVHTGVSTFYHCVFWNHQSGIYTLSEGTFTLNNCILWRNAGDFFDASLELNTSMIQESQCPDGAACQQVIFNRDPFFVDPENDDFRLMICSPAVDTGINDSIPGSLTTDFGGLDRVTYGTVDMGLHEFLDPEPQFRPTDVTSTGDTYYSRTLRAAIDCANVNPGPDTVRFVFNGPGPFIIQPESLLANLRDDSTVIDASVGFEPGEIILDGSLNTSTTIANAIQIFGDASEIYGLTIRNFMGTSFSVLGNPQGIRIGAPGKGNYFYTSSPGLFGSGAAIVLSGQGHVIQSNWFGLTPWGDTNDGTVSSGIAFFPIQVDAADIQIGGSRAAGEGNVFGNLNSGISHPNVAHPEATLHDLRIQGNYFGQTPDGEPAPGQNGISLNSFTQDAQDILIGGSTDLSNTFAFQENAVSIGSRTQRATIAESLFYCNDSAISLSDQANGDIQPPTLTDLTFTSLTGTTAPGLRIEIFKTDNGWCPDNEVCQGSILLGIATADSAGNWQFLFPQPIGYEEPVTATATDIDGNTSAFSTCALRPCPDSFTTLSATLCATDSLVINGTVYNVENPEGTEILSAANAVGCDSIVTVALSFYPPAGSTLQSILCPGESVIVNGVVFDENNQEGIVLFPDATANGCDSVVQVFLTFQEPATATLDTVLCDGGSLDIAGQTLDATGLYDVALIAANGCDSLLTVALEVLPELVAALSATICEGESYPFFGEELTDPGMYEEVLTSARGCDSTVVLALSLQEPPVTFLDTTLCQGETFFAGDESFDQGGSFQVALLTAQGCDSLLNLTLRYTQPSPPETVVTPDDGTGIGAIDVTVADPGLRFEWSDGAATEDREQLPAGEYQLTLVDSLGCPFTLSIEVPTVGRMVAVPNAFTPNGDGDNDFFNVAANVEADIVRGFQVFNRWGRLVYDHTDPARGWDGVHAGQPAPADVYFYQIQVVLEEGQVEVLRGEVLLLR